MNTYPKASHYTHLATVYTKCSDPGGLRLTKFMAEKMKLRPGARLLEIGIERI